MNGKNLMLCNATLNGFDATIYHSPFTIYHLPLHAKQASHNRQQRCRQSTANVGLLFGNTSKPAALTLTSARLLSRAMRRYKLVPR